MRTVSIPKKTWRLALQETWLTKERSPHTLTWKVFLIRQVTLRLLLSCCLRPSWLLEQNALTWVCDTTRNGFSQVPDQGSIWQGSISISALRWMVSFSCVLALKTKKKKAFLWPLVGHQTIPEDSTLPTESPCKGLISEDL